jgi:hypothetical protein
MSGPFGRFLGAYRGRDEATVRPQPPRSSRWRCCQSRRAAPAGAAFPGRNGRIVFMRFDGGLAEIQSMTATGGGLLNLTNTPLIEDRSPAWSADGKRIAFRRGNSAGPDQLWVMNADGTGLTVCDARRR